MEHVIYNNKTMLNPDSSCGEEVVKSQPRPSKAFYLHFQLVHLLGLVLAFIFMTFTGCKKDSNSSETSTAVYMHATEVSSTFDTADTIGFSATLVNADFPTVKGSPEGNITVHFKANPALVADYNKMHGTSYKALPDANFTLDASGAIPKGESATSGLRLLIKNGDGLEAFATYLLPITIEGVDGAELSNIQRTTYFLVTRQPSVNNLPNLDRIGWSVYSYSSQEPGEGDGTNNNGLAIAALDDDLDTYWHSKWDPDDVPPPHFIAIDMGAIKTLHGLGYICRHLEGDWAVNGHGQFKVITVSLSTDGTNWTDAGTFHLALPPIENPSYETRFALPVSQARYFKITVTEPWNAPGTSVAEIYAL